MCKIDTALWFHSCQAHYVGEFLVFILLVSQSAMGHLRLKLNCKKIKTAANNVFSSSSLPRGTDRKEDASSQINPDVHLWSGDWIGFRNMVIILLSHSEAWLSLIPYGFLSSNPSLLHKCIADGLGDHLRPSQKD